MKRNISRMGLVVLVVLMAAALNVRGEDQLPVREKMKAPVRSLYSKWYHSQEYMDFLIVRAKKAGMTHIGYIVAVPYGQANYNSKIFPRNPIVTADYDPLAYLIQKTKESGLKVGAWYIIDGSSLPGEIITKYNIKRNLDAKGNEGYRWYCVNNLNYIQLTKDFVREISQYDIDFLSWDDGYGFTGGDNYCFCEYCISKFQKDTGESLIPLKEAIAKGKVPAELIPLKDKWNKWKQNSVAALSRMIKEEAHRIKPGILVSSSGNDSTDAFLDRSQNAVKMIADGDQDMVEPELYYPGQRNEKNIKSWVKTLGPNADRFIPVLLSHNRLADAEQARTAKEVYDEVKFLKENGVNNIGWFFAGHLTDEQCYVLRTGELPPAVLPELQRTPGKVNIMVDEHVYNVDGFCPSYSKLINTLKSTGAEVKVVSVTLTDEVMAQFDVYIAHPMPPYRNEELWAIDRFLEKGGNMFFIGKNAKGLKQLKPILAKYGLGLGTAISGSKIIAVKDNALTEGLEELSVSGGNIEYPVNTNISGAKVVFTTADGKAAASMYEGVCKILILGDDWALHNGKATIPANIEVNKKFAENLARWLVKDVNLDKKQVDINPMTQTEIAPIVLREGENSLKKIAENIKNPNTFDYKDMTATCRANITVGKAATLKIDSGERLEMVCKKSGELTIAIEGKLLMNNASIAPGGIGLAYKIVNTDGSSIRIENSALKGVMSFLSRGDLYAKDLLIDSENQAGKVWEGSLHLQSGSANLRNARLVNPGGDDVGLHVQLNEVTVIDSQFNGITWIRCNSVLKAINSKVIKTWIQEYKDSSGHLYEYWYLDVFVVDQVGNPIPEAQVVITPSNPKYPAININGKPLTQIAMPEAQMTLTAVDPKNAINVDKKMTPILTCDGKGKTPQGHTSLPSDKSLESIIILGT